MNDSQAGKYNEEFFADVIPIEPVLGEMDYTNTREVINVCLFFCPKRFVLTIEIFCYSDFNESILFHEIKFL